MSQRLSARLVIERSLIRAYVYMSMTHYPPLYSGSNKETPDMAVKLVNVLTFYGVIPANTSNPEYSIM